MCWYMWRSLACPSTSRTLFSGLRVSTHGKQVASLLARFLLTAQGMGASGLFVFPGPARGISPLCPTAQVRGQMRGHTDAAGGRNGRVPTAETHIQESSGQVRRTMGQS